MVPGGTDGGVPSGGGTGGASDASLARILLGPGKIMERSAGFQQFS